MTHSPTISLMTPTWSGDLPQYRVLMRSLQQSPLADLAHMTVVQSEDEPALRRCAPSDTSLVTTAELLPQKVEKRRQRARRLSERLGRHVTRNAGSLARWVGWPGWPRYTGWHTQQLCKLAAAAGAQTDYVVAIDSDVIVTPFAQLAPLLEQPGIACFSRPCRFDDLHGKTRNWVRQADRLLDAPTRDGWYDCFFDTPFLLHSETVRRLLGWLEKRYDRAWWLTLLAQPPRRWSEFATYKRFVAMIDDGPVDTRVNWLSPDTLHYIFDASDTGRLIDEVKRHLHEPATHFITVHSQSSGRALWTADAFSDDLLELLRA